MARTRYKLENEDAKELRREAGRYIQKARVDAGLSQQELAAKLGKKYYTAISQVEIGSKRLPPDDIRAWAKACGVKDVQTFARTLFRCYDPVMFDLVFGGNGN